MARLSDLLNKRQPDNGWISMAELDAIERAQRESNPQMGQALGSFGMGQGAIQPSVINRPANGQIEGNFGQGQGAFRRSGGDLISLGQDGWKNTATNELVAPRTEPDDGRKMLERWVDRDGVIKERWQVPTIDGFGRSSGGEVVYEDRSQTPQALALRQKQEAADLDMQLKRAQVDNARGGEWQIADKSGVMINKRTGEIKKMPAGAGGGDIEWKYDAASDEFVAPPTQEFPMGRRSGNIAKTNAAKGMDYVVNQFKGTPEQPGALETATQGGPLGVKGLLGKVFDSQDSRRFDNLKEQMSTELRTLFRIPGEGTLSDKEQAQYGIQLPQVTNSKENNEAIIKDIQARIAARLDTGANPLMSGGGQQAQRVNSINDAMKLPSGTRFIDPNGVVRVRP